MGNTCKPMAVSFQCMTKSTTIKNNNNNNKKEKQREKTNQGLHFEEENGDKKSYKEVFTAFHNGK